VALEVDDVAALAARLAAGGVRLINAAPRKGAHGSLVVFVHPRSTGGVLVELVQPA
jgi:methylmalonyl-CoA/ethylmalonyl-CoA epimerase